MSLSHLTHLTKQSVSECGLGKLLFTFVAGMKPSQAHTVTLILMHTWHLVYSVKIAVYIVIFRL